MGSDQFWWVLQPEQVHFISGKMTFYFWIQCPLSACDSHCRAQESGKWPQDNLPHLRGLASQKEKLGARRCPGP